MIGANFRTQQGVALRTEEITSAAEGETLDGFEEGLSFFIYLEERALHDIHFIFLKHRLTALCTDPGRNGVPVNLIPFPFHAERSRASFHSAFAIRTFHHV